MSIFVHKYDLFITQLNKFTIALRFLYLQMRDILRNKNSKKCLGYGKKKSTASKCKPICDDWP